MVVENINGTELRFKNPGRLLLVVIAFLFWGIGLLDLMGHTSAEPDLFGLYSTPFFVLLVLYGLTIFVWLALFFNANLLMRVFNGVKYIQENTGLALILLAALAIVLWVIFEWDRWSRLPGLQFATFGLAVLTILILLLTHWNRPEGVQVWRKVIAYPLAVLLVLEGILQVMALFGGLPWASRIGGNFYPYERIYHKGEDHNHSFANRYGWNFPDTSLDDKKKRILIVGGSYVQALNVSPEQQIGVYLSAAINQDVGSSDVSTEVVPIGMPGFGLSPFLYDEVIAEFPNTIKFNEIIVVFHLGDDFQSPLESHNSIRYSISDTGSVEVHPDDAKTRHDLTHYYMRGYMSLQLVEAIRSNYLTPKVIASLIRKEQLKPIIAGSSSTNNQLSFPRVVGYVVDTYAITEPGHAGIKVTEVKIIPEGNNFMFSKGGSEDRREAAFIAESWLKTAKEITQAHNIELRIVTIPEFPEAYFSSIQGIHWETQLDEYDLLLPENELIEIAQKYNISILPMMQYMLKDGLSVEELEALYSDDELGSFTARGNEYLAEAVYACFYSSMDNTHDNCPQ